MLQGNGRWHVDISSSKHMVEGVLEQKYVYKMTSYPRGLGELFIAFFSDSLFLLVCGGGGGGGDATTY